MARPVGKRFVQDVYFGVGSGCRSAPGSRCKSLFRQEVKAAKVFTNSRCLTLQQRHSAPAMVNRQSSRASGSEKKGAWSVFSVSTGSQGRSASILSCMSAVTALS